MSSPTPLYVTPSDLATYLADDDIDDTRAQMMIDDAVALAAPIFAPSPVPDAAAGVIRRMAGRGYTTTTSSRSAQFSGAGSPFGGGEVAGGVAGVNLSPYDRADLESIRAQLYGGSGAGGMFTVDLLPSNFTPPLTDVTTDPAYWDELNAGNAW